MTSTPVERTDVPEARARAIRVLLVLTPLLVALSPLIPSLLQSQLPFPIYSPLVLALLLLMTIGVSGVRRSAGSGVVTSLASAAVVTTLAGAIAMLWTPSVGDGVKEAAAVSVSLLAAWASARALPVHGEWLRWSLLGWLVAWVAVLLGAAFEWLAGSPILRDTQSYIAYSHHIGTSAGYNYVASLLGNPNDLAGFLLMTTPLVLAWCVLGSHRRTYVAVVFLFSVASIWTGSRTAIGALVPYLIVMSLFVPRRGERTRTSRLGVTGIVVGGIGVAALLFVISPWADRAIQLLYAPFADDVSVQDQARAAWSAWALDQTITSHPILGAGPGSFEFLAGPLGFYTNLHDSLLEIGFQYGLVAMMTVIVALALVAATGLRAWTSSADRSWRTAGALAFLSIVGLVLWSFTSSSILMNGYWGLALGSAGALSVRALREANPPADVDRVKRLPSMPGPADGRRRSETVVANNTPT